MTTPEAVGATTVRHVDRALARCYGDKPWRGPGDPLAGLVATILSQHTTARNSRAAFETLVRRLPDWGQVAAAPVHRLAAAIRQGGLANQKAAWIKGLLTRLRAERGSLSLDFLADMPTDKAMCVLTSFRGVGPKTAACVLLFDLGKPVFPVDTHVLRISQRLGWLPPGTTPEAAHERLNRTVPPGLRHQLHLNMVQHGRELCRPRSPDCARCPILQFCTWPQQARGSRPA